MIGQFFVKKSGILTSPKLQIISDVANPDTSVG
jgi:hypothetical protein